ncbi:glycosyltransferase family 4 protein [uncultured Tateyamaria sp.]|uniref:glycosyltransferase family 4 protein n=1 Tax=uncultured Tateyamaria sp. TaxID=455651 RepID=UPI002617BF4C|nr:glycosyltransferase family 4 protein [uncultured Tateyamaria sp.]
MQRAVTYRQAFGPDAVEDLTVTGSRTDTGLARKPRIVVLASLTSSLVGFRYDLLKAMAASADVLACAPNPDPVTEAKLAEIGVAFKIVPMDRTGQNPLRDVRTFRALVRLFRDFGPDIVFPYTMKPIIYGGLAARWAGVDRVLPMCTGLGYVFVDEHCGLRKRLLRKGSVQLYRHALKQVDEVVVYNDADAAEFRRHRLVAPDSTVSIVPGSGVNLDRFAHQPVPKGPPVFLMVARLLRDKGICEYIQAARQLKARHPEVRCQLVGPVDANPSSITAQEVEAWEAEGVIEYLGETPDVRPHLTVCSVFVLPSYREGVSRTVLEAMSTGRAVITSDAPGCAEPVDEGVTGYIVPVRNADRLADAMARFVQDPDLAVRMGAAGRARAAARFDVARVNTILMAKLGLTPTVRHAEMDL